jgi:hypothetical protein
LGFAAKYTGGVKFIADDYALECEVRLCSALFVCLSVFTGRCCDSAALVGRLGWAVLGATSKDLLTPLDEQLSSCVQPVVHSQEDTHRKQAAC